MEDILKINRELQLLYENSFEFRKKMDGKKLNFDQNKSALAYQPEINVCEQLLEIFALEK